LEAYLVPAGFSTFFRTFPSGFQTLLEDLNALCSLVDAKCGRGGVPVENLLIDNGQAWIESRLIDLLHESRHSGKENSLYDACVFALFLITYKISTGIWEGCFIPEYCASQIIGLTSRFISISSSRHAPELVLWLLFVGGALAKRSRTKLRASALILSLCPEHMERSQRNWLSLKDTFKTFIWSEYTMERTLLRFWEELYPGQDSTL
jgi:hypothetical protein